MKIECYFDGACEPRNPGGNMGIGAVIYVDGKEFLTHSEFIPAEETNSNNVAEYGAFTWLLEQILERRWMDEEIIIKGDSMLVIEQMKGNWKIKKGAYVELALLARKALTMMKCANLTLQWIPREQNNLADQFSKGKLN